MPGVPASLCRFSIDHVLAGRYEGLRRDDFMLLIKTLQEDMWEEAGPYPKRPSSKKFVEWVSLAGGRVRGAPKPGEKTGRARDTREIAVDMKHLTRDNDVRCQSFTAHRRRAWEHAGRAPSTGFPLPSHLDRQTAARPTVSYVSQLTLR